MLLNLDDVSLATFSPALIPYLIAGIVLALLSHSLFNVCRLRHIPTVGSSTLPLLSYKGAYDYWRNARGVLQRGYDEHKGKVFKVAFTDRWLVVVTGKKLVDELQRLPEDVASFVDAVGDFQGLRHMFGKRILDDPFHVSIIRSQLTKHIPVVFDEIDDEVATAFQDLLPDNGAEWTPVHVVSVARTVVARASNRVFVGRPLCRDLGYLSVAVKFIVNVVKARNFLALFPPILKPVAAKITADFEGQVKEGMQYLKPVIEERLRSAEKLRDGWYDKPNDTLQWMLDGIQGRDYSIEDIVRIILLENFSSTMTTSYTFTHAIYHLAAQPEFIAPLRDEIEAVIAEEGWTKNAIGRMKKVDSLLRETLRHNGVNPVSIQRNALKAFSFSDGTFIPKGTTIVTPALATHMDDDNYESASKFYPFRFVQKTGEEDEEKHHLVTTAADFVSFGHGRQACPGRFFAANLMKTMLAHIIVNYDMKFECEGIRPDNVHGVLSVQPNVVARVLFRKRVSSLT